jgi:hypothetical protein
MFLNVVVSYVQIDAVEQQQQQQTGSRGANGHGYFDYAENKFVMADGR